MPADPATGGYGLVDAGAGEGAIRGGIGRATSRARRTSKIHMRADDMDACLDWAEKLGGKRLVSRH